MLQVWNDVQSGLSDNSKVFDCKIIFSHAILDRSQPFLIRTSGKYHSQAGSTNAIHKFVCFDNFNIGQAYMERWSIFTFSDKIVHVFFTGYHIY